MKLLYQVNKIRWIFHVSFLLPNYNPIQVPVLLWESLL